MLDDNDIEKLINVFATKEDLKEAVSNLSTKDDFNNLLTSVDSYAKKADLNSRLYIYTLTNQGSVER